MSAHTVPRSRDTGPAMTRGRRVATVVLACATAAAVAVGTAPPALAAGDTEVGIADDAQLLYEGPAAAQRAVNAWKAMGVDSVRILARWSSVTPAPQAHKPPAGFAPRDPADPGYNWAALDNAVTLLTAAGIQPLMGITGPGPVWTSAEPSLDNPRFKPDAGMFGDFAHALALHFKGRVKRYLIWNEPNQAAWLQPQFACRSRVCTPFAPRLYRDLFRAAAGEVRAVDPASTVLIGALAPRGLAPRSRNATMRPLQFIRSLGCVKGNYHRDRTGACKTAKPVRADGFSYHPHPVFLRPDQHDTSPDNAAIGDVKRLTSALDATTTAGIMKPVSGARFDLFFTEFGYQTKPPDPIVGISPARQAAWVQWADYIAWREPRVKNITQYEWIDEPVKTASRTLDKYAGWQGGLLFDGGIAKPLNRAFPNPFYVDALRGRRARFWGQVRPGGVSHITLQRASGSGWTALTKLTTNGNGYWSTTRALTSAGRFRFVYQSPATQPGQMPATVASLSQALKPRR